MQKFNVSIKKFTGKIIIFVEGNNRLKLVVNGILQFFYAEDTLQCKICNILQPRWRFSNVI